MIENSKENVICSNFEGRIMCTTVSLFSVPKNMESKLIYTLLCILRAMNMSLKQPWHDWKEGNASVECT